MVKVDTLRSSALIRAENQMRKSAGCLATLFLLCLAAAAPVFADDVCVTPNNLLTNCGFENGLTGWTTTNFANSGGPWSTTAPDNSVVFTRDTTTQEIYALDVDFP